MAGLAAAAELTQNGARVTLIEALSRLGGRIDGDMGASWMHDTLINPLVNTAIKIGLKLRYQETDYYSQEDGKLNDEMVGCLIDFEHQILLDFHEEKPRRKDISLKDYTSEFAAEFPFLTSKQRYLLPQIVRAISEHFIACEWTQIAASDGISGHTGRDLLIEEGYDKILEWVKNSIDWNLVDLYLNMKVTEITNNTVSVDRNGQTFSGDFVLCTLPLGQLSPILFKLELPGALRAAMKTPMANLGKVILEFPCRFWQSKGRQMIVTRSNGPPITICDNWPDKSRIMLITGPPLTHKLESNPDITWSEVKWALEIVRNNASLPVPNPISVSVSNWTVNPLFGGSYMGSTLDYDYSDCIQPFIDGVNQLRFAGEHTVFDGNGTVNGAYESGKREAHLMLEPYDI